MAGRRNTAFASPAAALAGFLLGLLLAIAPAAADWRSDLGSLRLGVIAERGAPLARVRYEPFRAYLEARLEVPVELVLFSGYGALVDAQAAGGVDYAIHSALSFVATERRCRCVEPLGLPGAFDGSTGFHAVLVARADGPVKRLADVATARLAVTATDSIAGYLAPLHALREAGIELPEGQIVHAADPEDALDMLFTGEADVAVGWASMTGDKAAGYAFGSLTGPVAEGLLSMADVAVVWQSPLIPFGPHAVRTDAAEELKALLGDALMALAREVPEIVDDVDRTSTGGGGFVAISADDYAYVGSLAGE